MGCAHSTPPQTAPPFHICGKYRARIIAVHDGATLTAVIKRNRAWCSVRIRLAGVCVPELHLSKRHVTVARAKLARDSVSYRVLHQDVQLTCGQFDGSGAVWGTVHVNGGDLGEWLIAKELGRADASTRLVLS